ncbi:thioredoxin domain-containing protein [Patulibacter sp.]|uniref:DsbA family protein n=1 Tax=Patulibacter sp. TaxID=1912859 RepID=UPI0027262CE9|nr:thioredoxin domain-containing protein [Patulibacter sp.]MDO9407997.1 thioredoxin domain-containing protein [Patulibacter sp.]
MTPPDDTEHDGHEPPASAAARRRRGRIAAGALALVVVLVAVVLAAASFDDPDTKDATRTTVAGVRLAGVDETRRLFDGVPQDGTLLGDPDAPVTIHEFADLKCPACQSYELRVQPETIGTLIRTGRASLRIHFIDVIDPSQGTTDGAGLMNAAYTLAAKDRMWPFVHVLYFNQGPENREWAGERRLREMAAGAPGVDPGDVSVRETPATRARTDRDRRLAKRLGVQATPTVFVEPRGTDRFGLVENPFDDLDAAVRAATPQAAPRSVAQAGPVVVAAAR